MKPDEWNHWSRPTKRDYAMELLNSPRGTYLMYAALAKAEDAYRDSGKESDADDLAMLRETLFNMSGYSPTLKAVIVNPVQGD